MKELKLVERLYRDEVRRLCIEHNYYTRGDNDQYMAMFALFSHDLKARGNITSTRLLAVAKDIKAHSNTDDTVEDIVSSLASLIRVEPVWED